MTPESFMLRRCVLSDVTVFMPVPVSYGKKFNVVKTIDDFYILIVPKYRFGFSDTEEAERFIEKTVWHRNDAQAAADELGIEAVFDVSIPCVSQRKEDIFASLFAEMTGALSKTYDARLLDMRSKIRGDAEAYGKSPVYTSTYGSAELYYVDGIIGILPNIAPLYRANVFEIPFKMRDIASLDNKEKRGVLSGHMLNVLKSSVEVGVPDAAESGRLLDSALQSTVGQMAASGIGEKTSGHFVFTQFREYLLSYANGGTDIIDILSSDEATQATVQMLAAHEDGTDIGEAVSRMTAEMIASDLYRLNIQAMEIEYSVEHIDNEPYRYKESERVFSSRVFTRSYHVHSENLSLLLRAGDYALVRFLVSGGVDSNGIGIMGVFGEERQDDIRKHPSSALPVLFGKQMKSIITSDSGFADTVMRIGKESGTVSGEQVSLVISGGTGDGRSFFEESAALHKALFEAEGTHGAKSVMGRLLHISKEAFYNTTRTRLPASIAIMRSVHDSLFGKNAHYAKTMLSVFASRLSYTDSFRVVTGNSGKEKTDIADISEVISAVGEFADKHRLSDEKHNEIAAEELKKYNLIKKGRDILETWSSLSVQYNNQYKKNRKSIEAAAIEVWQMFGEPFFSRYSKNAVKTYLERVQMSPNTREYFGAVIEQRDEVAHLYDRNTRTAIFVSQKDIAQRGRSAASVINETIYRTKRDNGGKAEVSPAARANAQKRPNTRKR